ncbi:MAG TPA: DUF3105 domain-containing protein [Actinomycetota bacterium]|nr:DUF3105 domain-containing protein [Actinomycetota bacterium]
MAKKKKDKKRPPPGVDPNEKRRERLEAKRAAKAAALAAKRKKEARERIVRRIVMVLLAAVAVWFLFLRTALPDEINGHRINEFSTAGANQHTDGPVAYEDSPPVSGQHAGQPTDCGVYSEAIPNETMVHNLEHGAIGLLYRPDADLEDIRTLESIVADYDHSVFSMPYQGQMESPITIAAWGYTMELDTAEEDSVTEFIDEFRRGGAAPEADTPNECAHQDPEPFQPAGAEASPAPDEAEAPEDDDASPEPEDSPTN